MLENVKESLHSFGKYVVQQSRSNLTKDKKNNSKELYNSINYEVEVYPNSFLFRLNALPYAEFIDKGVRGANPSLVKNGKQKAPMSPFRYKGKMPPVSPLIAWAKSRNIRFRNEKGQFAKGNYRTIGFVLQKRIYAQGFEGTQFMTRPFIKGFKNLPEELIVSFGLDIKQFLEYSRDKRK